MSSFSSTSRPGPWTQHGPALPDAIPVLSYSIKDIDLRLSDDLDELERRNSCSGGVSKGDPELSERLRTI